MTSDRKDSTPAPTWRQDLPPDRDFPRPSISTICWRAEDPQGFVSEDYKLTVAHIEGFGMLSSGGYGNWRGFMPNVKSRYGCRSGNGQGVRGTSQEAWDAARAEGVEMAQRWQAKDDVEWAEMEAAHAARGKE
jgi:hypothetical protein